MSRKNIDASVADLVHAVGMIVRRVRGTALPDGLSLTESLVVGRLANEGPMTTAELARREGIRPQSMRTTIEALETQGIVEREPHPMDRRQAFIVLTRRGAELRASAKAAKRTWLAHAVARLPAAERETLFAATAIMRRLAES